MFLWLAVISYTLACSWWYCWCSNFSMQLSVSYFQIVIIWSIRIVRFSGRSSMVMVKDVWTNGCGSLLDWKCQCLTKTCPNDSVIVMSWFMKNFEESVVYWQGLRKKYVMDPSFQGLVKVGLTPLSRRPGFCFLRDIQARLFVLLQGVFFLGFWSMFKNNMQECGVILAFIRKYVS